MPGDRLVAVWLVGEVLLGLCIAAPALVLMAALSLDFVTRDALAAVLPRRTWFPIGVALALQAAFFAAIPFAIRAAKKGE